MPTSPHRRVQRDSSAKRLRSWVQRASEAPDVSALGAGLEELLAPPQFANLAAPSDN